ncbi:MAG TPA: MarR family transcriptional regulator [Bryobacteraceae bacterium]|nr:MarR family transcriptional regulator [Bryobacteraceae bacterium]
MVVESSGDVLSRLDLGYAALFLGLRVNELVVERLAAAGFGDVRESHGYVIQHLIESERSITELAERMEVTQQAASKVVAELAEIGILEISSAEDRRAKKVRLSARGWESVRSSRRFRQQLAKRLVAAIGVKEYESARATLLACMEVLGGLPSIRSRRVRPPR